MTELLEPKMKKLFPLAALLMSTNLFAAVERQAIIVPAYNYPEKNDSYWNAITAIGSTAIPYVIVNPADGSGNRVDKNYVAQINKNNAAGIRNIGYIYTNYQTRPIAEVYSEVDKYMTLYGESNISGFFFDEIAVKTPEQVSYMANLYNYVKSRWTDKIVMGNPGREITDAIAPYADIFVTAEMDSAKYFNRYKGSNAAFEKNADNAKHIMHIIHSADPAQYAEIIKLSRGYNAGWLYVTDDVQNNPYDQLPTNFAALAAAIANAATSTTTPSNNNAMGTTNGNTPGASSSTNNGPADSALNSGTANNSNTQSQYNANSPINLNNTDNSTSFSATVSGKTNSTNNTAKSNNNIHQAVEKPVAYIPRSKVDLDLTKNARAVMYQNVENPEDHNVLFNIAYMGGIDSEYEDNSGNIHYGSTTHGIILTIVSKINRLLLGGGVGYQQTDVEYQKQFAGIEEDFRTYQLLLSGKYEINDNVDITTVLTYSNGRHKFKTATILSDLNNAKYTSKIWDWNARLGYKFLFSNGYIKPYIGAGVTNIHEGNIDKIEAGKTSSTTPNAAIGVYGQFNLNAVELFGNIEYERRLNKKSTHGKRHYTSSYDIAKLKYRRSAVNAGIGVGYRITDAAKLNLGYELRDSENNQMKVGFEYKF